MAFELDIVIIYQISMLRNYILTALRIIIRNKVFSSINIFGLALGMASTIIILVWVQDEMSYDRFHEKSDRIYHVYLRVHDMRSSFNFQPTTSHELGLPMFEEIPEIIDYTRMGPLGELGIRYQDRLFLESGGWAADPNIFDMFSYQFIHGTPGTALTDLYSAVLTETFANKYFGDQDPVGKVLRINNILDVSITAVIHDLPDNTHRKFDFLIPFELQSALGIPLDKTGEYFANCSFHNYVLLQESADAELVNEKVIGQFNFEDGNISGEAFLVPLPQTNRYSLAGGDLLVYVLTVIALLILLIACINFMNLSTARATTRIREVGIRKVAGAERKHLNRQFIGETLIYSLIALNFAIIFVKLFMPVLNNITQKEMSLNYFKPEWMFLLILIWLFTGIVAGSYPALFLSKKKPVLIFQHHGQSGKKRAPLRKTLVIIQFAFTSLFLISVLIINRQFYYMDHTDLGYNKTDLVYIRLRDETREQSVVLRDDLSLIPGVERMTNTSHLPVLIAGGYYQEWGRPDDEIKYLCQTNVDYEYMQTLELSMAEGRFYSRDFPSDSIAAVVVNEMAINQMDLDDPLGKTFFYQGEYYNIIGVMKDFHHVPLVMNISPIIFKLRPEGNDYMLLRISPGATRDRSGIMDQIRTAWEKDFPENPLEYNFLEDYEFPLEQIVVTAERLVYIFTLLAVIISCLGLFGLSTFMAERRVKEIGIRKVFGSTINSLVSLLSWEYLRTIVLATAIGLLIALPLMKKMLEVFAYRIELKIWMFASVALIICLLAMLTVGFQALRTANKNPAESLRYE